MDPEAHIAGPSEIELHDLANTNAAVNSLGRGELVSSWSPNRSNLTDQYNFANSKHPELPLSWSGTARNPTSGSQLASGALRLPIAQPATTATTSQTDSTAITAAAVAQTAQTTAPIAHTTTSNPAVTHSLPVATTSLAHGHTSQNSRWHPKLTGYRILFMTTTSAFGIAKAIQTYRGNSRSATTFDWLSAVVITIVAYFVGLFQKASPPNVLLFEKDYATYIWKGLAKFHCPIPTYETSERDVVMLVKQRHPPLTGYRLLVIVAALGFGLGSAITTYMGETSTPTTVSWVYGVVVTVVLYWLGLYELNTVEKWPALFEHDYADQVGAAIFGGAFAFLHVVVVLLAAGWSYFWISGIKDVWGSQEPASDPKLDENPPSPSKLSAISDWSAKYFWTAGAVMASGFGLVIGTIALASLIRVLFVLGTHIKRRLRSQDSHLRGGDLLPSALFSFEVYDILNWTPVASLLDHRVIGAILRGLGRACVVLFVVAAHGVAGLLFFSWTSIWFSSLLTVWPAFLSGFLSAGFLYRTFSVFFLFSWSISAVMATISGIVACGYVLISLLSYLFRLFGDRDRRYYSIFN